MVIPGGDHLVKESTLWVVSGISIKQALLHQ